MYRNILVGFDGSDHGRDAAALARSIAQATGARLTFVCAFYDVPDFLPEPLRAQVRERAEKALRDAGDEAGDARRKLVSHRSPARALFEFAEEGDADLIVLGSSRQAPAGHVRCGDVGAKIVAGAPCAVAIAPAGLREHEARLRLVGVGVDEEKESRHALRAAIELARACGARLHLMSVVERIDPVPTWGFPFPVEDDAAVRAAAQRALDAAARAVPEDVAARTAPLDGFPVARALADEAATAGLDLLAVGSRGFGPLRRVLLGSVSSELTHDAPCALLVVPRGARDVNATETPVDRAAERVTG